MGPTWVGKHDDLPPKFHFYQSIIYKSIVEGSSVIIPFYLKQMQEKFYLTNSFGDEVMHIRSYGLLLKIIKSVIIKSDINNFLEIYGSDPE